MASDDDLIFEVGQRYENRKGPFEVVSLEGATMRIRWDNGEEITTDVELQARIMRNMEREMTAPVTKKKSGFRAPDWFGGYFKGLREEDFTEDVTGTHWRSREQLGGAVAKGMHITEPFNSWAVYKRPEVHWTTVKRRNLVEPIFQTKFFVRIWADEILFGLYVERSNKAGDPREDWNRFVEWLKPAAHVEWLWQTLMAEEAFLSNPYPNLDKDAFWGEMRPVTAGYAWVRDGAEQMVKLGDFGQVIAMLPPEKWLNLLIGKRLLKAEAVGMGAGLAKVIYDHFNKLLPVFESKPPEAA